MPLDHNLEKLSTALNAHLLAADCDIARTESRLFDACLNAGMSFDEPSASEWASARVAHWLMGV